MKNTETTKQPAAKDVPPIWTHALAIFWEKHGRPDTIGQRIEVEMQSGNKAIFELCEIYDNFSYKFKFINYLSNASNVTR